MLRRSQWSWNKKIVTRSCRDSQSGPEYHTGAKGGRRNQKASTSLCSPIYDFLCVSDPFFSHCREQFFFFSFSTPWAKDDFQNFPILLQVLSPNAQKGMSIFPGSMEMHCQSPQGASSADVHYQLECQKPCSPRLSENLRGGKGA